MTGIEMVSIVVERPWPTTKLAMAHGVREKTNFDFIELVHPKNIRNKK